MSSFEVLAEMSRKSQEILLSPLSNVKQVSVGSKGWGSITIAVPSDVASKLLNEESYYVGGLLLANKQQYNTLLKSDVPEGFVSVEKQLAPYDRDVICFDCKTGDQWRESSDTKAEDHRACTHWKLWVPEVTV